ncbi:MAG: dihydropteroate synthase [Thermaerobacter sp.]|nr:dihydropteroate synthase [Thermaerobacter sp.]
MQQAAPNGAVTPYIPLNGATARALAAWIGIAGPLGRALVGTEAGDDPVPGARRCPLPGSWTDTRRWWWVEDAAAVGHWVREHGRSGRRRWPRPWTVGDGALVLGAHTHTMGIVNLTPDSFSDGGRWTAAGDGVQAVRALRAAGLDWVDVGGESTRPGHTPVDDVTEWQRVAPVLEGLLPEERRGLSLDTRHPAVGARALELGVPVLNDVSCLADPAWLPLLARARGGYVLMYNRPGPAGRLDWLDVLRRIGTALDRLRAAGVALERIIVDPGIGFAYGGADNVTVLNHLGLLRVFDRPILAGPSRKRFLGHLTGRPVDDRDRASAIAAFAAIQAGADMVRLHDAAGALDAARMADALEYGGE